MTFVSPDGGIWQELPESAWPPWPGLKPGRQAHAVGPGELEASRRYCLGRVRAALGLSPLPAETAAPADGYEEVVRFLRDVFRGGGDPGRE